MSGIKVKNCISKSTMTFPALTRVWVLSSLVGYHKSLIDVDPDKSSQLKSLICKVKNLPFNVDLLKFISRHDLVKESCIWMLKELTYGKIDSQDSYIQPLISILQQVNYYI